MHVFMHLGKKSMHPFMHLGKKSMHPFMHLGKISMHVFITFSYTFLRTFSIEKSFFYSYTGSAELARLKQWCTTANFLISNYNLVRHVRCMVFSEIMFTE